MAVKPQYIKDTGRAIMREYSEYVSTDFEHNKKLVEEVTNVSSKPVKNRMAGYLVSLKNQEMRSSDGITEDSL